MIFHMIESYGDCTSSYNITLDKNYTVEEFINIILKDRPNEWGSIEVSNIDVCRYSQGKLLNENFSSDILHKNIKKVVSHGGWTLMDYIIYL